MLFPGNGTLMPALGTRYGAGASLAGLLRKYNTFELQVSM